VKIVTRVLIFVAGALVLFFGWHKAHTEMINLQNPGTTNSISSSEVLVVVGGFVLLMAFLPSQQTLGRWMSLKKPRKAQAAHFRRRRK